ncbi:cell wall-binding repeat-containing protein, partial [Schumannella luteola]
MSRLGVVRAMATAMLLAIPFAVTASPAVALNPAGTLIVSVVRGASPVSGAVTNVMIANAPDRGEGDMPGSGFTDSAGEMVYPSFPAGDFLVWARVDGLAVYAGGTLSRYASDIVTVRAGQTTRVTIAFPQSTGSVTGTVDVSGLGGTHLFRADALAFDEYGSLVQVASDFAVSAADPHFRIDGIPPGEVIIRIGQPDPTVAERYSGDVDFWWQAETVTVTGGSVTSGIDIHAEPASPAEVVRLGGSDRFAMAVSVSQEGYPDPSSNRPDTVYVANGLNFPDALSAGPLAAGSGPLLLVTPFSLPDVVRDEIRRLGPAHILIVGGPASVGDDVAAQLGALAPDVQRVSGADRYAVSRALAVRGFPGGSDFAVV